MRFEKNYYLNGDEGYVLLNPKGAGEVKIDIKYNKISDFEFYYEDKKTEGKIILVDTYSFCAYEDDCKVYAKLKMPSKHKVKLKVCVSYYPRPLPKAVNPCRKINFDEFVSVRQLYESLK